MIIAACSVALGCSQRADDSPTGTEAGGGEGPPGADAAPPPRATTAEIPGPQPDGDDQQPGRGPEDPAASDQDAPAGPADAKKPPSKQRRPLFRDWPDPRLALLISGRQDGYMEPCGCTGLATQKGGLARRHSLQQSLREKGWPLVAIDAGNQVRRYGRQSEIKFQFIANGLSKMDYRAIALGPDDLRLSVSELVGVTASAGDGRSPFVSANVTVLDPALTPRYVVVPAGGKKLGVTTVLGASRRERVTSDEIIIQGPSEGLTQVWPQLEQEGCDLYVLVADAEMDETLQLAQQFPGFNLVVTTGGAAEPPYEPDTAPGAEAMLVQVGRKGTHAVVIGVFDDADNPLRYERVPLDARFSDSRDMLDLLASYQSELERAGLQGLGLSALPHPSGHTFVGSKACADCHTKAFAIWEKTKHAHATQTLVQPGERSEIPRHFDPECLSCHVVGWNPQKFFPYRSGYLGLDESPAMHGVGCENCHGPGSAHVAAEQGDVKASEEELTKLRESVRLPLTEAEETCMECHDLDNSPDFLKPGAFLKYWKKVQHEGLD
jgi:hypothetical protein